MAAIYVLVNLPHWKMKPQVKKHWLEETHPSLTLFHLVIICQLDVFDRQVQSVWLATVTYRVFIKRPLNGL